MVRKSVLIAALALSTFGAWCAEKTSWQPAAGHEQIPLWPGTPPGSHTTTEPETSGIVEKTNAAGRPWIYVSHVSRPTLTVYSPTGKSTGAAVVVFPGGGYQNLAIDIEGTEVCDWLTSKGIACILLKYRVPNTGEGWNELRGAFEDSGSNMALEDAQRTLGLVRLHAEQWHIDPHKIGVIGFSAGGHLVAAVSTHFEKRVYPAIDEADKQSCRPDFAMALYPGHLWLDTDALALNPDIHVTAQTPPTFLAQAENDRVDDVKNSLVYYAALKSAGVAVEMHLFAEGGHAFGLHRKNLPVSGWPTLAEVWLKSIGVIPD